MSTSNSIPYLDVSKLDEDDKEDLTHQLSQDTSDMIMSFANLIDEICVSLEERKVSVKRVVVRALSSGAYGQKPLMSEDEKELKSCKTIDEVFIVLRSHMSFFNFELLEHITASNELCSGGDRMRMYKYIRKFEAFCRRKVFEVPPGLAGPPTSKLKEHERETFAVLMTQYDAEPNLVFVIDAKWKISKLLNLKPSTLYLHRIDKEA